MPNATITVDLNAMESEVTEIAVNELGIDTHYDDGRVIEVGDEETKDELVEKLYDQARNTHGEMSDWYSDAGFKINKAPLED